MEKREEEMKVVEGSVWIPFICVVFMAILLLMFQSMEWGICQQELLINCSGKVYDVDFNNKKNSVKEEEKGFQSRIKKNIHFLKHVTGSISESGEHIKGSISAEFGFLMGKKKREKTIEVKNENPIKKLRRRKRIEEGIQK